MQAHRDDRRADDVGCEQRQPAGARQDGDRERASRSSGAVGGAVPKPSGASPRAGGRVGHQHDEATVPEASTVAAKWTPRDQNERIDQLNAPCGRRLWPDAEAEVALRAMSVHR